MQRLEQSLPWNEVKGALQMELPIRGPIGQMKLLERLVGLSLQYSMASLNICFWTGPRISQNP